MELDSPSSLLDLSVLSEGKENGTKSSEFEMVMDEDGMPSPVREVREEDSGRNSRLLRDMSLWEKKN